MIYTSAEVHVLRKCLFVRIDMKKKDFTLKTPTDIKVFMLYVLDRISYPIAHKTFIDIVSGATEEISLRYDEAIKELCQSGHVIFDEVEHERYYMISDMGKMVASELYDTLDKELLEKSLRVAAKYISFIDRGVSTSSVIEAGEKNGFTVTLSANTPDGEIMCLKLQLKSKAEAEKIKAKFDARPESVYRGILIATTGISEFLK